MQVRLFTISTAGMALLATNKDLDYRDIRVLLLVMSEHDRGHFDKGQAYISECLGIYEGDIRKICLKLEKLGYIIRQKNKKGAVISIMVSPFIMFQGRRNQEDRKMQMSAQEVIRRNRKIYYDKLAKDPNDYPNAGKAVWPGYGPNGTDWVYEEKERDRTEGD